MVSEALILASGSVARRRLLESAHIPFQIKVSNIDEGPIKADCWAREISAVETAIILARAKADNVGKDRPDNFVLGVDQILVCEGLWFDKPAGRDALRAQLVQLGGRIHKLINVAVVVQDGAVVWQHQDVITMVMRPLSNAFIETYINEAGEAACQSVGGYQLEGMGAQLFDHVGGDFFSILGLPLLPLLAFMRRCEIVAG